MSDFTTDDVALAIEIRGVYDGTCVWLLKDGSYVNRFAGQPGWPASLVARVDAWIAQHGDQIRHTNQDLLDTNPTEGTTR